MELPRSQTYFNAGEQWMKGIKCVYVPSGLSVSGYLSSSNSKSNGVKFGDFYGPTMFTNVDGLGYWKNIKITRQTVLKGQDMVRACDGNVMTTDGICNSYGVTNGFELLHGSMGSNGHGEAITDSGGIVSCSYECTEKMVGTILFFNRREEFNCETTQGSFKCFRGKEMEKRVNSLKIPKGYQVRYQSEGKTSGKLTGPLDFTTTTPVGLFQSGIFRKVSPRKMTAIEVVKLSKDPEYLRLCTVDNLQGDCAELHITEAMLTEEQTAIPILNHIPFATNFDFTNDASGYDRKTSMVRSIMLTKGFEVHFFTDDEDQENLRMFGPFTGKVNLPSSYYDDEIKVVAVRMRRIPILETTECD